MKISCGDTNEDIDGDINKEINRHGIRDGRCLDFHFGHESRDESH